MVAVGPLFSNLQPDSGCPGQLPLIHLYPSSMRFYVEPSTCLLCRSPLSIQIIYTPTC